MAFPPSTRSIVHSSRQRALPTLRPHWTKTDILLLDDLAAAPLADSARRDLLELLDDRLGRRATIVTSQVPVEHWQEAFNEPTVAAAILDRLVHTAFRITLTGESMRRRKAALTETDTTNEIPWSRASPSGGRIRLDKAVTLPWTTRSASRGMAGRVTWNAYGMAGAFHVMDSLKSSGT